MATIIIRNLDEQVAERLRLQARLRGVSVEEEARRVLAEGTRVSRAEIAARAAAIRARQRPPRSRGVELIRKIGSDDATPGGPGSPPMTWDWSWSTMGRL